MICGPLAGWAFGCLCLRCRMELCPALCCGRCFMSCSVQRQQNWKLSATHVTLPPALWVLEVSTPDLDLTDVVNVIWKDPWNFCLGPNISELFLAIVKKPFNIKRTGFLNQPHQSKGLKPGFQSQVDLCSCFRPPTPAEVWALAVWSEQLRWHLLTHRTRTNGHANSPLWPLIHHNHKFADLSGMPGFVSHVNK